MRGVRGARAALLVASLVLGCFLLARRVDQFYAIERWLVWRYAGYWLGALVFTGTCQIAGYPLVERLGRSLRFSERLLLSQAVGMVVFFLALFVLGVLHLFNRVTFFALPLGLIAMGARPAWRAATRFWRLRRAVLLRPRPPLGLAYLAALALGLLSLVIVYSQIIHPLNTSYDARWYHLPIAEQYAAEGHIVRYTDGSYPNAYPHLASFLFTWAFLAPAPELFDKVELCAHMVFTMFGWILVGVALLTRRLIPRAPRGSWAVMFLFPGLFLYDSGLHVGADHPAALFAAPIALCALAVFRTWSLPNWLLLAIMVGGAVLTKYSVSMLLAVPLGALTLRGVYHLVREPKRARAWLIPPLLAGALALALTAPHWLKNWLFYGNPVYPYASSFFPNQVWGKYNREIFETWSSMHEWRPHGPLAARLEETARAVPFFAFEPHDWPAFHRDVPVFGFLFSLAGLALPFVRGRSARIWVLMVASYVGIFLWYMGMHQDRYLQVLLPWMTAATAAILVLAWRTSRWARIPLVALIGLQGAWGADVPFIPGHAMLGKPPTTAAIELASSGYRGDLEQRFRVFEPYQSMAKALVPGQSRVLLHESHMSLGFGTTVLEDYAHTQGMIDYGAQPSLAAVHRMLTDKGVTHIVWTPRASTGWAGLAGDFVFFDFLRDHTTEPKSYGGFLMAEMKRGADADLAHAKVAFLACLGGYTQGLYSLQAVNFPDIVVTDPKKFPKPEVPLSDTADVETLLDRARYVAYESSCGGRKPRQLSRDFAHVANRGQIGLWARERRE